jgi:HlyD family secretion protein
MTNRLILYLALGLAVFSWGRAFYVKGVTIPGDYPAEAQVDRPVDEDPRYPEAWPVVCSGRVEAIDGEINVASQIAGPLTEVRVTEGDYVPKGAVLAVVEGTREANEVSIAEGALETARARLKRVQAGNGQEETDEARFQVRSTEATLASETSNLERDRNLYMKRMISREDYERRYHRVEELKRHRDSLQKRFEAIQRGSLPEDVEVSRSQVAEAEARVRRARVELEYRTIRAPVSGLVTAVYLHAGDSVSIEKPEPILRLIDTSRLRIRLEVDEVDVPAVQPGMEGTFQVRGDRRAGNTLTVQTIIPAYGPKRLFNPDTSARLDTRVLNVLCMPSASRIPLYPGQRITASFTRTRQPRLDPAVSPELRPESEQLNARLDQYILSDRTPSGRP